MDDETIDLLLRLERTLRVNRSAVIRLALHAVARNPEIITELVKEGIQKGA